LAELFLELLLPFDDFLALLSEVQNSISVEELSVIGLAGFADGALADIGHASVHVVTRLTALRPDASVDIKVVALSLLVSLASKPVACVGSLNELLPYLRVLPVVVELLRDNFLNRLELRQDVRIALLLLVLCHVLLEILIVHPSIFIEDAKLGANAAAPSLNLVVDDVDLL